MNCRSLAVLLAFPGFALSGANLELQPPQPLVVDQNGNATTNLSLCNNTDGPIKFNPNLSDFEHEFDGKKYLLGTTKAWGNLPATVPKGCISVQLTVSKIWEAGLSKATLRNGADPIAIVDLGRKTNDETVLRAVRLPETMNVQVVSPGPDSSEIHFVGNRALVALKNSDPLNYPVRWKLQFGGNLVDGGPVLLKARSTTHIQIPPDKPALSSTYPSANFLISGTLKDEVRSAQLILTPDYGDQVTQPLPAKELPVALRFSRFSGTPQEIWNAFWILVLLSIGGLASLFVNSGIPNYKGALALGRNLDELEEKLDGIDSSIESRWRVLLACHVRALRHKLDANPWWYPSFAPTLAAFSQTAVMLRKWVDLTYAVALVMHDAQDHLDIIPPTVLRQIEQDCERALAPIQTGFTNDTELGEMHSAHDSARKRLDNALSGSSDADLVKEITDRENRLKPMMSALIAKYPDQFGGILQVAEKQMGQALAVADYRERDINSLKAELIHTYDTRLESVPARLAQGAGSGSVSVATPPARARLLEQGKRLADYLIPNTHDSLRLAMLFGEEMQQDFYPGQDSKMIGAVRSNPPQLVIHQEPYRLMLNTPVRFSLQFEQAILNEAAARREWTCEWSFGHLEQTETGWEIFHTFTTTHPIEVSVQVKDLDGVLQAELKKSVKISSDATKWYALSKETHLELIRLLIVLVLALFGLMATAQQKARNLSFLEAVVAVVAIGFGAGAIKDMIVRTDKSKETT